MGNFPGREIVIIKNLRGLFLETFLTMSCFCIVLETGYEDIFSEFHRFVSKIFIKIRERRKQKV